MDGEVLKHYAQLGFVLAQGRKGTRKLNARLRQSCCEEFIHERLLAAMWQCSGGSSLGCVAKEQPWSKRLFAVAWCKICFSLSGFRRCKQHFSGALPSSCMASAWVATRPHYLQGEGEKDCRAFSHWIWVCQVLCSCGLIFELSCPLALFFPWLGRHPRKGSCLCECTCCSQATSNSGDRYSCRVPFGQPPLDHAERRPLPLLGLDIVP